MFSFMQKVNTIYFYIWCASDHTTSDFDEGMCGLLMDSDWTAILVDKPDILFLNESSMDVNNIPQTIHW